MQTASKRVRSIYSVIASPQRLEILRILNTKGPLSYSALKSLAGFKSKKESGKFAYHLRKLVRVMLIQLNRQERKYNVTNFGRMVLNVTRQIEEQSQVESGKLYVRTSHQKMEEFNANKIMQSLVKEAGMPVELAQKITSEAESRIYKFQTQYLTAPLIREIVNSILIEQNFEEYRHKLTRLGMPVYDVTQLLNRAGSDGWCFESLLHYTGQSVFSEYLLLDQLPRDVSDAHLSGDIHISNAGSWGLVPDSVFVDLLGLRNSGLNPKGRIQSLPVIPNPDGLESAVNSTILLASLMIKEVSSDLNMRNFVQYVGSYARSKTKKEIEEVLTKMFELISTNMSGITGVSVNFELEMNKDSDLSSDTIEKVVDASLDAYSNYVENTPVPRIKLVVSINNESTDGFFRKLSSIIVKGGMVATTTKGPSNFEGIGIQNLPKEIYADNICILHNLSLNLPRLAYESNQDETYFRAKLAMLMNTATSALISRKKMVDKTIKSGLLPSLNSGSEMLTSDNMPMMVNLVGLEEALNYLAKQERNELAVKIAETASQVAHDKSVKSDKFFVTMVRQEGISRLYELDVERYGKSSVQPLLNGEYMQINTVDRERLKDDSFMSYLVKMHSVLKGGVAVRFQADGLDQREIQSVLSSYCVRMPFVKISRTVSVCKNCGSKLSAGSERCQRCKSVATYSYVTA